MLAVTSTIAYATIFDVLFGPRAVLDPRRRHRGRLYSALGGMWSITLTDMVQFVIKTIGIFFLLLPFVLNQRRRLRGLSGAARGRVLARRDRRRHDHHLLPRLHLRHADRPGHLAARVHRAPPRVASWGGTAAGLYCLLYAVAGALIGMAAEALLPDIDEATTPSRRSSRDAAHGLAGSCSRRRWRR